MLEFHQGGFEAFDTNGNGVIDANDDFATVGAVEYHGESRISITLDVGAANLASGRIGASEIEPGPHTITIWGETKLTADDFVPTNLYRGDTRQHEHRGHRRERLHRGGRSFGGHRRPSRR